MPPKPKEVLKKLESLGFEIIRSSGSHLVLRHKDGRQTYISMHTKDLPIGTYRAILKQANISKDDFEITK